MTGAMSARRPDDWVERVRAATDIVEVIGETVALKRVGRNWSGLCPFHAEKTPSFSVSADRQFYHCFGCKAGGDVFRFVQENQRVGFLEAVEILSRRAGIPVPERRAGERGAKTPLLDALEAAAQAYEQWLRDPERGAEVRAVLAARGLAAETIQGFRLGLAPAGWEHLAGRLRGRVGEETLLQAGLVLRRDPSPGGRGGAYDRFRNRLMIPLVAVGGAVVGFGARALGDESPKYLNSPETLVYHKGSFLFAFDQARRAVGPEQEIIVVEGYFDAMALHQCGLQNVVATSGTALTSDQARLLRRAASRVALTYDGDRAGQEAMSRSLGVLLAEGLEVAVVELPAGEDPDTLVRARGVEAWRERRAAALDAVAFVQRHVLREGGPGDGRERALQAVTALVAQVRDPIRRKLLLERAAETFGFPEAVLARAAAARADAGRGEALVGAALRDLRQDEADLEGLLLRGLLHQPECLESIRAQLAPEDFQQTAARELASWIWAGNRDLPEQEPAATLARELMTSGSEGMDWAAEAEGASRRMVTRRLRRELKECRNRLSRAAADSEAERLMHEMNQIARALRELSGEESATHGHRHQAGP